MRSGAHANVYGAIDRAIGRAKGVVLRLEKIIIDTERKWRETETQSTTRTDRLAQTQDRILTEREDECKLKRDAARQVPKNDKSHRA
jgi:hypothetical protein